MDGTSAERRNASMNQIVRGTIDRGRPSRQTPGVILIGTKTDVIKGRSWLFGVAESAMRNVNDKLRQAGVRLGFRHCYAPAAHQYRPWYWS